LRLSRLTVLLVLGLLLMPLLSACGGGDPLTALSLTPATISPNETSTNRTANLNYVLSRRSDVTVSFTGPDGGVRMLRDHQTRTPGSYTLQFDGAFDGHVLPDGVYHWTFTVSDTATHQVLDTHSETLTITQRRHERSIDHATQRLPQPVSSQRQPRHRHSRDDVCAARGRDVRALRPRSRRRRGARSRRATSARGDGSGTRRR